MTDQNWTAKQKSIIFDVEPISRQDMQMSQKTRTIVAVAGVLLALLMMWYFFDILVYIILAGIISLVGQPLVDSLSRLHYKNFRLPKSVSALITIVALLAVLIGLLSVFVPLIMRQASMIALIDVDKVTSHFSMQVHDIEQWLLANNILKSDETLEKYIRGQMSYLISVTDFEKVFTGILSTTGTLFIGMFSVLFLSFFFLRDRQLLKNGILLFTPDKFQKEVKHVLHKTKVMLSRYVIGLLTELLTMMVLISIGLSIFGVKNALLIGFLGGLMNVIPYLGPIIGASMGVVLGVSSALSLDMYGDLVVIAFNVLLTFGVANLIDNIVLQPLIYSRSVNAHPIEIFLVILMAGSLAGIPGMILAIPSYTVIRIVSKEFLSGFKVIDKLTENI